jgi:hypothetical protein
VPKDAGITDELSLLIKKGIEVACAEDDIVGQGEDITSLASLIEVSYLAYGPLYLESTKNLVTREDGKGIITPDAISSARGHDCVQRFHGEMVL